MKTMWFNLFAISVIHTFLLYTCSACNYVNEVSITTRPIPVGVCYYSWYEAYTYRCEDGVAYIYKYTSDDRSCSGSVTSREQVTSQLYNCADSASCPYLAVYEYWGCGADKDASTKTKQVTVRDMCINGVLATCSDGTAQVFYYDNADCSGTVSSTDTSSAGCSGSAEIEVDCEGVDGATNAMQQVANAITFAMAAWMMVSVI